MFLDINMNDAYPAVHLWLKLKRNDKIRLSGNSCDTIEPFFNDIDEEQKWIVEKCKNNTVNERVFPYIGGDDDFREVNYRPFNNAIKLNNKTYLSEENTADYIIDDINTEWALSAIEQLTYIYKEVSVLRLYTHMPFKLKFVIMCREKIIDQTTPLTASVINKINLERLHDIMSAAQGWTKSMIWVAETGEDTYVSSDMFRLYIMLMSDLLDEL